MWDLSPHFHTETPWFKGIMTLHLLQLVRHGEASDPRPDSDTQALCRAEGGLQESKEAPSAGSVGPGSGTQSYAADFESLFPEQDLSYSLCFSHSTWICSSLR